MMFKKATKKLKKQLPRKEEWMEANDDVTLVEEEPVAPEEGYLNVTTVSFSKWNKLWGNGKIQKTNTENLNKSTLVSSSTPNDSTPIESDSNLVSSMVMPPSSLPIPVIYDDAVGEDVQELAPVNDENNNSDDNAAQQLKLKLNMERILKVVPENKQPTGGGGGGSQSSAGVKRRLTLNDDNAILKSTNRNKLICSDGASSAVANDTTITTSITNTESNGGGEGRGSGKSGCFSMHILGLECPKCRVMQPTRAVLKEHLQTVHQVAKYVCLLCENVSYENYRGLNQHKGLMHPLINGQKLHCPQCDRFYASYDKLRSHHDSVHQHGHFQCASEGCQEIKESMSALRSHQAYYHGKRSGQQQQNNKEQQQTPKTPIQQQKVPQSADVLPVIVIGDSLPPPPLALRTPEELIRKQQQKALLVSLQGFPMSSTSSSTLTVNPTASSTPTKQKLKKKQSFTCTWPRMVADENDGNKSSKIAIDLRQCCLYAAAFKQQVVHHIRKVHFGLPVTLKEQQAQGIVDDRQAKDYVRTG